MPFIKISGLTTATAVSATNQFEINQNGGSRSATVAQVAAFARTSATDPVVLPAGTVSAPALTFTGDTNTGIYSPAADTIAFTEGGVEAMRIDASGRVGIATASPGYRFHVVGDVYASNSVLTPGALYSDDGATVSRVISAGGISYWGTTTSHPVVYQTSNTERMRIDSSGNVGIGTSSPGNRLDIVSAGTSQIRVKDGVGATAYYDFGRDGTDGFFGFSGAQTTFSGYKWSVNAGSEVMRITNGGNVGIGTSSPGARLEASISAASGERAIQARNTSTTQFSGATTALVGPSTTSTRFTHFNANAGGTQAEFAIQKGDGSGGFSAGLAGYNYTSDFWYFSTNNTERARIDSSGNFMVGTTSSTVVGKNAKVTAYQTTTSPAITSYVNATANSNQIIFGNPNGEVGTINTNGTTTSYGTSSDYRLKYDVQPMLSGLSTISALKPSTYKWNADNSYGEGFIAHELQAVIPQAVTGEKDAVNENGSIKPQGVDYSKIVVHLVAAIQELKAEIDLLKGKQ